MNLNNDQQIALNNGEISKVWSQDEMAVQTFDDADNAAAIKQNNRSF